MVHNFVIHTNFVVYLLGRCSPVHVWFLEIAFVPEGSNSYLHALNEVVLKNYTISTTFLSLYMALTIDSIVRHGISTKLGHECLLNETKVMLYYPYIVQEVAFLHHQQDASLLSYKLSGYIHIVKGLKGG